MTSTSREKHYMTSTQGCLQRYQQLLIHAGICPSALGKYARAASESSDRPGIRFADCLDQPDRLRSALRMGAGQGADWRQLRIHASVLHQDLALSVIAPLTIRLFLTGRTCVPASGEVWLVPGDACNNACNGWRWDEAGQTVDVDGFTARMAEQVNAWYPFFRQEFGVSPGAYWSSVGLGLCAPFSALYDKAPPAQLCQEATRWLNRFHCEARQFIDWIPVEFDQHPCAIPQRRGCCLKYKLPDGAYCGTCGIYRKERMAVLNQRLSAGTVLGQASADK